MFAPLLFCLFFIVNTAVAQTNDIIVFENPSALIWLDESERPVTCPALSMKPLPVDQSRVWLSDQIHQSMKVRLDNRNYFILLDRQGLPVNLRQAGYHETFKNVQRHADTILILTSQKIKARYYHPVDKKFNETVLPLNTRLIRLFSASHMTMFSYSALVPVYGFVTLRAQDENRDWTIQYSKNRKALSLDGLYIFLTEYFRNVSKATSALYYYYQEKTGQSVDVPVWSIESQPDQVICKLDNPHDTRYHAESIEYIRLYLESYLFGTNYKVKQLKHQIIIDSGRKG